jgi:PAS domain S-box-containing protein
MTPPDGTLHSGEADARFRLFFERSSDAILLLDTASNHFVQYNDATLEMLRCTREELAALHPSALSPHVQPDGSDSFSKANEMIALALARGNHRFEWTHCSPHRADFPVEVVLTPVTRGERPVVMVVWRDITERKRAEEAQLRTQKLDSLGLLASGIAHDFNNLLTAMMGNLALIRLEVPEDSAATEYLRHLDSAVQKAAHLTRQMLAYSGQGSFTVAPMDLGREVRDMAELLASSVPKGVRLVYEFDENVPTAKADAAQVEQVIMNLVLNAAEAIGDGEGLITLRTSLVNLKEEHLRRDFGGQMLRPGPFVQLEVQDSGAGMSPEVLARIYDPFFSTKKSGRGLGLSALLGIVKAHRGGVLVRSAPGWGTTFSVFFPATSEPLTRPPSADEALPQFHGATLLLVEDEPMVRRSTRALMEKLGFTVLEAGDGLEALEVFSAERHRVRCVLMDLTMPRMDGHTAFLALQQQDPSVKVVLYSGWAATDVAERFRDHPPAGFLSKPFVLAEVLAALREAGVTAG